MPFLFRLIETAVEREKDDRLHDQYCAILPYMTSKEFKTFEEWKMPMMPKKKYYDNRSTEDIMKELRGE